MDPLCDTSIGIGTGKSRPLPRRIVRAGQAVTAFAIRQPDGTVNVHIIEPGRAPLTVLGIPLRSEMQPPVPPQNFEL